MFVLANQTLKVYGTGMFTILPGAMNRHDYPLDSTGVVLRSYGYPYSQLTMRSQGSANRVPNAVIHQGSFGCEILAYIGMSCFVSLYHPWAFGFANGWRFDEDWAHMVMLHDFAAFSSWGWCDQCPPGATLSNAPYNVAWAGRAGTVSRMSLISTDPVEYFEFPIGGFFGYIPPKYIDLL